MSRAVGLAIGATLGALGVEAIGPVAVMLAGAAVGLAAVALRGAAGSSLARRGVGPLAVGLLLIGLRGWTTAQASIPVTLPTGEGPWAGTIVSVGSANGPTRPAVVRLDVPDGLIVAATLPLYPVVGADDRISLRGPLQPPPQGDYAAYLARVGAAGTIRAKS